MLSAMSKIGILEADVAEPIEDVIARAERQAEGSTEGHVEFNLRFVYDDHTVYRRDRVRFLADNGRFVLAERLRFVTDIAVPSSALRIQFRESWSDVLLWTGSQQQPPMRPGDTMTYEVGGIVVSVSAN
jgi:hypothetical protein